MRLPAKMLFAAVALPLALAAGAAPSQAGILEIILGGLTEAIGGLEPVAENADRKANVNAEIVKGKVEAREVGQRVTRRNVTAAGRSVQNYAVIDGRE